ncbi:hypothetical protein Emed_002332 [Eimeria media]
MEMSGNFQQEMPTHAFDCGMQCGSLCSPVPVQTPYASGCAGMWPSSPLPAQINHLPHIQKPSGVTGRTRRWSEEYDPPLQSPASPPVELRIFCPVQGSRHRRAAKALQSSRSLSTSRTRMRKASSPLSHAKFELAAVAALCRPGSAAPASPRCLRQQQPHFPPAASFVPGRQRLPWSSSSPSASEGPAFSPAGDPSACVLRRTGKEGSNRCNEDQLSLSSKQIPWTPVDSLPPGLPSHAPPALNEPRQQPEGDTRWACVNSAKIAAVKGQSTALNDVTSGQLSSSPLRRWQFLPLEGTSTHESIFRPQESPVRRVAAAGITCKGFPYIAATKKPSSSNVVLLPNKVEYPPASAEPFVPHWQAPLPAGYQSIGPVPIEDQVSPSSFSRDEARHEQAADVITTFTTDRFWQLMDVLGELQRGPTSLACSSVTFDSVLLPGGELQYALIEKGSFGRVFMGTHQGSKVAIKVPVEEMLRSDSAGVMERTLNEWQILSMCQHPNIVKLVGGIVHGPFDVWLVTHLANGSDLHSRKYSRDPLVQRTITPENGLYMCRQLAAVVAYLHAPIPGYKPVIVHRDIKPENVLIADDWSIQLCDFGDAEASPDGRVSRISGATWFYAPAELLRSSPVECTLSDPEAQLPTFNEKWDVWSMGCVFQEMFGLLNPMHVHISSRDSPPVIYQKLRAKAVVGALVPEIAKEIQGIARTIIARCLEPDPDLRPSAAEVLQMWSANDHEILKDISLGLGNYKDNPMQGMQGTRICPSTTLRTY